MSCVICCESLFDCINNIGEHKQDKNWEDRPSVLRCGHVFHQGCISAWIVQSGPGATCPTCRTKHSGDLISLFFETDDSHSQSKSSGIGASATDQEDTLKVKHRNRIIKTLCSNVEHAQAETRKTKELLQKKEEELDKATIELKAESEKLQIYKTKLNTQKKGLSELTLKKMQLDQRVAYQAELVEEQKMQIETLEAELIEQKRVVRSMGEVRTVNEQLVRQLRKEKAKVRTVTSLNTKLANRISSFERTSDYGHKQTQHGESDQLGEPSFLASFSPIISQVQEGEIWNHNPCPAEDLNAKAEDDLAEDVEAIRNSGIQPHSTSSRNELSQYKRGFTFEVPVAEFEATNIIDLTSSGSEITASLPDIRTPETSNHDGNENGNNNPFSAVATSPSSLSLHSSAAFQFRAPLITPKQPLGAPEHRARSIRRPPKPRGYLLNSDGFGGSRRSGHSVQAKINWGSKKT